MGRCRVSPSSASWILTHLLIETQALEGLKKLHCPELQCSQQSQDEVLGHSGGDTEVCRSNCLRPHGSNTRPLSTVSDSRASGFLMK